MADLEPITREEMLLDGQDLEPITRKEMFIKRIYDKTQVVPEPITREEMFLKKAGEGGSDVDVEQLNVSSNGTYSESGKAYSPVIVNVQPNVGNINIPSVMPNQEITRNASQEGLDGYSSVTVTGATLPTGMFDANGTYTASEQEGGWSEVVIDVPLPENAYLLKDIEGTPSDIATFTDGSALPMPKLEVAIEPIQEGSGEPSPTNIRPIIGWSAVDVNVSGKNWCPVDSGEVKAGNLVTFSTPLPSGTYSVSFKCTRTGSSSDSASMVIYDKDDIAYSARVVIPNTGGRLNIENLACNNGISRIYFYSIAGSWGSSQNYTLGITEFQVEIGSTATTYEPYNPNSETITIQLGDTYYGAKLDVVSGVLTLTHEYVDLGTLTWTKISSGETPYFRTELPLAYKYMQGNVNSLCSNYSQTSIGDIGSQIGYFLTDNSYIRIRDTNYTSASDFKTAMNGVQLVYELATPIEIQLTPTQVNSLEGVNNINANSGKIINGQYFSKGGITI